MREEANYAEGRVSRKGPRVTPSAAKRNTGMPTGSNSSHHRRCHLKS